jgi:hypothetical protein
MKKLTILISLTLTLAACSKALVEKPQNFLSPVNFYKNGDEAQAAINGAYSAYYIDAIQDMFNEIQSDYATGGGSYTSLNNMDQVLDAVQTGRSENMWNSIYTVINRANVVLTRVPPIKGMDEAQKKRILAEAHFLRAVSYFNLVKNWGGVPLRTTETADLSTIAAPRASADSVFALITADLLAAEAGLPESVGKETGKASKWAAKMFLAEVYLWTKDWSKSAKQADDVINSNRYSLVRIQKESDFYQIFATETNPEDIMSWHSSVSRTAIFVNYLHLPNTPFYNPGTGWYILFPNMKAPIIKNWDNDDLRKRFNIYSRYVNAKGDTVPLPSTTPYLFKKFIKDPNGYNTYSMPIVRYSEAFLIYAEASCRAEGSPSSLALERLNMIKRRGYGYDPSQPSPVDYPPGMSMDAFIDTVLTERAHEFMLEGRRWYDLKRTGLAGKVIEAAKGMKFNKDRLLYPIPESEINNNPAIHQEDQNPGY